MKRLARGFDLSCGFLFAALLTSRVLVFGFEEYSAGNAFVAVVCAVLLASCGLSAVCRREVVLARSRAWIPLGAYLLFSLLGVIAASNRAAAWKEFGSWAIYGGVFVASAAWARTEGRRRLIFASFLAAACVEGMYALFQRRVGLPLVRAELAVDPGACPELAMVPAGRARALSDLAFGTFIYPNALSGFLVLALPVAAAFFVRAVKRKNKTDAACLGLVAGLLFLSLLAASVLFVDGTLAGSLGGWVALFAAAGLFATRRFWLSRARAFAAAGVGALVLGSLISPFAFFFASPLGSFGVRREYWKAALSMIRTHPLGVGLANFGEHYPAFKTPLGWETRLAHNAFFQNWAELGLWGMLAFAVLCWALVADASEGHDGARGENEGPLVHLGLGGGMFAFFVGYGFLQVMNSGSVGAFLAGKEYPYLGLTAACHLLYPLVWLGVFACAMKTGTKVRALLACALAGLLVHAAVDFDMRVKGIVLPAFALAGTAGWARGEFRLRLSPRGTIAFAAALGVLVAGWTYFLAARPLARYSAKARAEGMDGVRRRAKTFGGEIALLWKSSPSRAAKEFSVLASALPGRELDELAVRIKTARGATRERLLRRGVSLIPKVSQRYAEKAAGAWAELAKRAPLDPEAHSSVARALGSLRTPAGNVTEAWEYSLKEAIRLGPASPGRRESLGHFYAGRRRFRDASAAYAKAVERYPLKPVYRYYLGDALLRSDPDGAREEYARALRLNRRIIDDACLLQEMMWNKVSYVRKGGVESETADLLTKEEGTETRLRLGLLFWTTGRREEAAAVFTELAEVRPGDSQLVSFLACAREVALDPRASGTWKNLKALQASSPAKLRDEVMAILLERRRWMRSVR